MPEVRRDRVILNSSTPYFKILLKKNKTQLAQVHLFNINYIPMLSIHEFLIIFVGPF